MQWPDVELVLSGIGDSETETAVDRQHVAGGPFRSGEILHGLGDLLDCPEAAKCMGRREAFEALAGGVVIEQPGPLIDLGEHAAGAYT